MGPPLALHSPPSLHHGTSLHLVLTVPQEHPPIPPPLHAAPGWASPPPGHHSQPHLPPVLPPGEVGCCLSFTETLRGAPAPCDPQCWATPPLLPTGACAPATLKGPWCLDPTSALPRAGPFSASSSSGLLVILQGASQRSPLQSCPLTPPHPSSYPGQMAFPRLACAITLMTWVVLLLLGSSLLLAAGARVQRIPLPSLQQSGFHQPILQMKK